jgi:ketosteroid isomerase-like protein
LDIPPILLGAIFLIIIITVVLIPRVVSKIKRPIKWRNILIIVIIILVPLAIFYAVTQIPSEQIELTEAQKEIDLFLLNYYDGLRNMSTSRIVDLFTENAIVVSSEGTTYKGTKMIKRYFDEKFIHLDRYDVVYEVSDIKIEDELAKAVYHSEERGYITGATLWPIEGLREEFTLVKQQGSWKIKGLIISHE